MPRILKRPMFRSGGSTNEGIMHGLVDRKGYENGTEGPTQSEIYAKEYYDQLSKIQPPKPRFNMGQMGLNLVSGKYAGDGLLQNIAGSAQDPYTAFTKEDDTSRNLDYQTQMASAKMGISKAEAEAIAKAKALAKDTRTTAVKNAMSLGLVPGTKAFNKYVQAATVKGGGLNIQFNDDGSIKSISEGGQSDSKFQTQAMDLKNATFAMNNVATTMLKNLEGAKVGTVGGVINALDSIGSQLKQAAEATGFKNNFVNTGSNAIDDYLKNNLGEGIFADAVQYGKLRSNAINLAYLMARVDEPGGRFTDRDIALKMEEIGIGSNPQKTAQILAAAVDLRNKNAAFAYKQLTDEELSFEGFSLVDINKKETSGAKGTEKDYNPLGYPEDKLAK